MGVFSRFSDIVNANINALLDKAEDPEKLVRLIVQEMEETLVEVRSNSAQYIADKKSLERQLTNTQRLAEDWAQKAELAITKGRDDLAKAALVERNKLQQNADSLAGELEQIEQTLTGLKGDITRLQTKLEEAKQRQKAILLRRNTAVVRLKAKRQLHHVDIEQAVAKFEHYENKIDQLEAEVESYELGQSSSLQSEFNKLESDEKVEAQLAELKKKVANG
ncbi:phage shock protein PspA [Flocculibacter collagenilyticus]|uniref:phage shock protein PspA n=1 Tax=Flocculibacter collagenilyticus TaxID=2744479 RepID=UPI0018F6EA6B|nr:phage shock protein PspA [Flocculibacter collagenilyticus]